MNKQPDDIGDLLSRIKQQGIRNLVEEMNAGIAPQLGQAVLLLKSASQALEAFSAHRKLHPAKTIDMAPGTRRSEYFGVDKEGLVKLWLAGGLDGVLLCEQCRENWFIATRKNHQFCSRKCREASHWGTDKAKAAAKLRMRKYRKRLKKMEQNQLKAGRNNSLGSHESKQRER